MPGPFFNKDNFEIVDGKILHKGDGSQISEQRLLNRKANIPAHIENLDTQIAELQAQRAAWVKAMDDMDALIAESKL